MQHIPTRILASLLVLLCVSALIYIPGSNGAFLLDDHHNLSGLADIKQEPSLRNKIKFSLEGVASSLGRPISLASFALQAESWPNPNPFKQANIIIHLLCGILIFILVFQLLSLTKTKQQSAPYLALIITAAWLLHPMQASTVLYTIQRMAQLSALFVLLGLVFYLHGRAQLALDSKSWRSYAWMACGIVICTPIAVLSKENGALLPLYALVIEYSFFRRHTRSNKLKAFLFVFCIAPTLALATYLASRINHYIGQFSTRDFSMYEKVLTEFHVLSDYLRKIALPTPSDFGLYHDHFPVSTSLFSSTSTILSICLIFVLICIAVWIRKKSPFVTFGILFFFAAHALESTFLPLELYFEHRNYLAILGPLSILFIALHSLLPYIKKKRSLLFVQSAGVFIIIFYGLNTLHQANIWGGKVPPIFIWEQERPESLRAKYDIASTYIQYKKYKAAHEYYVTLQSMTPHNPAPFLASVMLHCYTADLPPPNIETTIRNAKTGGFHTLPQKFLNKIALDKEIGECPNIENKHVKLILDAFLSNPNYQLSWHAFYQFKAMIEAGEKNYGLAAEFAEQGFELKPDIRIGLNKLQWLHLSGKTSEALSELIKIRAVNNKNTRTGHLWQERLNEWEQFLIDHLNNQESAASIPTPSDN